MTDPGLEVEVGEGVAEVKIDDVLGFAVDENSITVQVASDYTVPMVIFCHMIMMYGRKERVHGFESADTTKQYVIDGTQWVVSWSITQDTIRVDKCEGYTAEQELRGGERNRRAVALDSVKRGHAQVEARVKAAEEAVKAEKINGGDAEDAKMALEDARKSLAEIAAEKSLAQDAYDEAMVNREKRETRIVDVSFLAEMAKEGVRVKVLENAGGGA